MDKPVNIMKEFTYMNTTENWNEVIIDDIKYFAMIENQVRKKFVQFEANRCLDAAQLVIGRAGISEFDLKEYPVEGYYNKNDKLKLLFKIIRNLQQNREIYKEIKLKDEEGNPDVNLEFLKNVYESELFGQAPSNESYPWPDAPLKRQFDIVTKTMQDEKVFDAHSPRPWTIKNIMAELSYKVSGQRNLPELAAKIGKAELVCAACESNSLGRMFATLTGSAFSPLSPRIVWQVTQEIEEFGTEICFLYNKVMGIMIPDDNNCILPPTSKLLEKNYYSLDWTLEKPRVCHLGYLIDLDLNYFWIMDESGVRDLYQKEMLTTENYCKTIRT